MKLYSHAPFVRGGERTPRARMSFLFAALTGIGVLSLYYNGPRLLVLTAISLCMAAAFDLLVCLLAGQRLRVTSESMLQAVLLTLFCPATVHLLLPAVGVAVMMILKQLLRMFFRQAPHISCLCAGWCFLAFCFPANFFTYAKPGVEGWPPIAMTVAVEKAASPTELLRGDAIASDFSVIDVLLGNLAGPMGACGAVVLMACIAFLCFHYRTALRTAVGAVLAVTVCALLFPRVPQELLLSVLFEVCGGSLLLCAAFALQVPGAVPLTHGGQWMLGIVWGLLTVVGRRVLPIEQAAPPALLLLTPLNFGFDLLRGQLLRGWRKFRLLGRKSV